MADPSAVEGCRPWICSVAGHILGETPQRLGRDWAGAVFYQSLKPIKGDLLLFFQKCFKLWQAFLIKFNISVMKTELLQADWLLNAFLPAQARNYCRRWRRSSITWCCTLIMLDILLLSVKNYLHVCKFPHYANDFAKATETGGQTTSASQPFSGLTYVMILLRQDNNLYFYVNNSFVVTERTLWQGFRHHRNHPVR